MLSGKANRVGASRARVSRIARNLLRVSDGSARGWMTTALLTVTVGSAAASVAPLALKAFVDQLSASASASASSREAPSLLWLIAAYAAAILFQRMCEQVQTFAYARGEQRLIRRFAAQSYAHILTLPMSFHHDNKSGTLAQSLSDGVMGIRLILTHLVLTVAPVVVQIAVAGLVLAIALGPTISFILVIAVMIYGGTFAFGVVRLHSPMRDISAANGELGGVASDGLMNVETIKAFTAERRFTARYDELLRVTERRWELFSQRRLENGVATAVIYAATVGAVYFVAGSQIVSGATTLGALVLVNTYLLQLMKPLELLAFAIRDFGQGFAYLDRISSILNEEAEEVSGSNAAAIAAEGPGELVFEHVSFSYGERQALEGISFRAAPGEIVAIVGESGAGKSTLLKLIMRFHEPLGGVIRLDGQPLSEIALSELRRQIALVPQDTILFNDTLGANIAIAADRSEDASIQAALAQASLAQFVATLPEGLDTRVGERGLKLSGGQRQRVAVARAFLKGAKIVVFDEATAALDPATERKIWKSMKDLARGATTIVVTHRLSTIAGANQILVMDHGRIVERGRHEELMSAGGVYFALWHSQNRSAVNAK